MFLQQSKKDSKDQVQHLQFKVYVDMNSFQIVDTMNCMFQFKTDQSFEVI